MTRSTLRRTAAAATAVLALGFLSACGGDDDGGGDDASGGESTSESSESASSEPTEESSAAEPEDGPAAGEEVDRDQFLEMYRSALEDATSVELAMEMGTTLQGEGVADFSSDPVSMQMTIDTAGQEIEVILVDGAMYTSAGGGRYIKTDASPIDAMTGGMTEQFDPDALIETFDKGFVSASFIGEEDVEGEQMEHYSVVLDPSAVLQDAQLPGGKAPAEMTSEIWFDGEGMPRRMEIGVPGSAGTVVTSYDNWGEPVEITAPPAGKVVQQ